MAKFFKPIGELCTPAKVYMVIAAVSILASFMTDSLFGIAFHAIVSLLWAFFLGWLCDSGHSGVSWFLVLWLPALMFVFIIFGFVYLMTIKKEERKALSAKLAATEKKKKDDGEQATEQIASPESFHPSMFGGRSYEGMTNANKQPSKETIKKMATIAQKAINSQGKKSLSQ